MSPPLGPELFTPSGGEQCSSPWMIGCWDAWLSEWFPVSVRQEGIRRRPALRESILGHPGGPLSRRKPFGAETLAPMVDGERAVEAGRCCYVARCGISYALKLFTSQLPILRSAEELAVLPRLTDRLLGYQGDSPAGTCGSHLALLSVRNEESLLGFHVSTPGAPAPNPLSA